MNGRRLTTVSAEGAPALPLPSLDWLFGVGVGGSEEQSLVPVPQAKATKPPTLKIKLTDDRALVVNGRKVSIPRGLARCVTGAALRVLGDIYRAHTMYLSRNGSAVRVRDGDVVELTHGTEVTSRDERPAEVVSRPSFHTD